MNILFLDTETTGLPLWKEPDSHPGQPRICQIGLIVADEAGKENLSFKCLLYPDGWTINEDAEAVTGITTKHCEDNGISFEIVFDLLKEILHPEVGPKLIVCHNASFDMRMLNIEAHRYGERLPFPQAFCTMLKSTDHYQIPGNRGFKWPKLSEAYQHFFGETLLDAHDALVDVRACMRIYYHLKQMEQK